MLYKRTIKGTMNPDDVVRQANAVAEAMRADGRTVEVGEVYESVNVRDYGMPCVDLTYTEPSEQPAEVALAEPVDTPKPLPLEELAGTPETPATVEPETVPETAEPENAAADDSPAAAPPATEDNVLGNDVSEGEQY